jgi:hypothetical protein
MQAGRQQRVVDQTGRGHARSIDHHAHEVGARSPDPQVDDGRR